MIERKEYQDRLISFKDKRLIKVVTGVRRCGKSTLLSMFQGYLRSRGVPDDNIVSVNFEDYDFAALREPDALHSYLTARLSSSGMTYIFLDEIQNVRDFPVVLDSLFIRENVDLYATGSNAYMLSSDIATLLSGRYIEISMLPLSFSEYVSAVGGEGDLARKYANYISRSSFPYAVNFETQMDTDDYLMGIYNTVIMKDVAGRHRITDPMMLESVTRFLFDNIGSQLSTKRVSDIMTSDGRKIDAKTVERYISALMDSFVIYQAKRYDIKGGQFLRTLEKYYAVDVGLRRTLLGSRNADMGHILENVIYLELLRRGYRVYIGKVGTVEVDFVAMNGDETVYLQAAATVRDENTLKRELLPLQKINDSRRKFIVTLDEDPESDFDGIRKINAYDFLLKRTGP
ncbi:MAG: ATP-binding protein [Synergistaceae bacterium]|nr:ATP-binding protein [Synergistaceae bacterium]